MPDVHESLRRACKDAKVMHYGDEPVRRDILKLRGALVEGIADAVSIPEVSTDNTRAAHDLLGCMFYSGILNVMLAAAKDDVPHGVRMSMYCVVIESLTSAAARLILDGQDILRRIYGHC